MVTYLFGAGASRNAVPIIEDLKKSMLEEKTKLRLDFKPIDESLIVNKVEYPIENVFNKFIEDFDWVTEKVEAHQSVDTFAKKLYIRGEFELLKKLKTIMSIYFLIIQSKNKVDARYDGFFASILQENHLHFPSNLRVLTWNYDYQFEKAYAEYSSDYRFEACQTSLNIYSKNSRAPSFNGDRFGIIKLNGTASLVLDLDKSYPHYVINSVNESYNPDLFKLLLGNYASMHYSKKTKDKLLSSISFAWEDYSQGIVAVKNAIKATEETEILVVIGYSFPFFNRFVDRDIIKPMKKLKKVYFQAPDAEKLKERFLSIRNDLKEDNLVIRKDVDQFVFPNEL
jgi:hypothetical protein